MINLNIYTDGAHSSKTNVGGWAIVITADTIYCDNPVIEHNICHSDYELDTTNNRMELTAVIKALEYIEQHINYWPDKITAATIYSDSAYIVNCLKDKWYLKWQQNNWRTANRTPVLNKDLWEQLLTYYTKLQSFVDLSIQKVEGHSSNYWNNLADHLAVQAREKGAINEQQEKN